MDYKEKKLSNRNIELFWEEYLIYLEMRAYSRHKVLSDLFIY